MFNEERLTKKMSFSKKARAAFSLSANAGKENARAFACRPLFVRKSASQGFAPHAFFVAASLLLKFVLFGFCLAFVSCANIFQDKVAMSRSGASATLGAFFVGGETIENLDTPSEIHVSLYEFKDKIRISWSPVKHARYYVLERAVVTEKSESGDWVTPDESEYEPLERSNFIEGTSFTDIVISGDENDPLDCENKKYGYVYFYRVRAENPMLGYDESEPAISSYGALLPPPSGTKATAGESEKYIEVTWTKSLGASRYEIYRSENEDGTNSTKVGTVTSDRAEYIDENVSSYSGKDLFYTVRAISSETKETSVASPVALGYTLVPGAPGAVKEVRVKKGHGDNAKSIEIEWDSIEESGDDGITYTVYRSSSESSTMKKLGAQSSPYKDSKDLKPNVYYYYYVQTSKVEKKDENDKEGTVLKGPMSKSGPDDASPAEGFILSAPSTVEVKKIRGETEYLISFTPVIGDENFSNKTKAKYNNNYEYVVLGDNNQSGSFSNEVKRFSSSNLEFANGKYSAKVSPRNFYKMKVEYGKEGSAQTAVAAPAPYEAQYVYVTRAQMVEDYSKYTPATTTSTTEPGTNSNGVHAVKITWKAPEGGAHSYNIYRSEKLESGFRKITDSEILDTGKDEYEYIDRNNAAKPGSIYYYKVLSLNSLGQGVEYSEIDAPTLENGIIKTKNADGSACGRGWGWGALSAWQYMREERKTVESSQKKLKLMHKPNNLDKVGSETINGDISGTLSYNAKVEGLGARITMPYKNYADSYIGKNPSLGIYFLFNGDTNTTSNMSANGNMDGTVTCSGMYPGKVIYNNVEIKGGAAGGGTYGVIRDGIDSSAIQVDWKAGDK